MGGNRQVKGREAKLLATSEVGRDGKPSKTGIKEDSNFLSLNQWSPTLGLLVRNQATQQGKE